MLIGVRIFIQPGCLATAQFSRQNLEPPQESWGRFDSGTPANINYTTDLVVTTGDDQEWRTPISNTGIPNETQWDWTPCFSGAAGIWFQKFTKEEITQAGTTPVSFTANPSQANVWRQVTQLLQIARPSDVPIIIPGTTVVDLFGDNTFQLDGCDTVDIQMTDYGNSTNTWYGLADVRKFGFVTEVYDNHFNGGLHYLNFANQRVILTQG